MRFRITILPCARGDIDRNADWWADHYSLEQALRWSDAIYDHGGRDAITVPEGAAVIEATGLTLLPGLLDSHFHMSSGACMPSIPGIFLRRGVTSARDPGRPFVHYAPIRALKRPVPRLFLTGGHLDQPPPAYPANAELVANEAEARAIVNRFVDLHEQFHFVGIRRAVGARAKLIVRTDDNRRSRAMAHTGEFQHVLKCVHVHRRGPFLSRAFLEDAQRGRDKHAVLDNQFDQLPSSRRVFQIERAPQLEPALVPERVVGLHAGQESLRETRVECCKASKLTQTKIDTVWC